MPKFIDLTGRKFGRISVVCRVEDRIKGRPSYRCLCECGNESVVSATALRTGKTISCGCYNKERRVSHGLYGTPEYKTLIRMIQRCEYPNNDNYKHYGAKGIKVCLEWRHNPQKFLEDMGKQPSKHHSIDRIDTNKGYSPDNCKWSTHTEQNRNRNAQQKSVSGYSGVRFIKKVGKWEANIIVDRRSIYLGRYRDVEDAIQARKEAEQKYWLKESS